MNKNKFSTILLFVQKYENKISTKNILELSEKIAKTFKIELKSMGYSLLHPKYEYKDIGKEYKYNLKSKKLFLDLEIPHRFFYNEEKSAPIIYFNDDENCKNNSIPHNFISIKYPTYDYMPLEFKINVNNYEYNEIRKHRITHQVRKE